LFAETKGKNADRFEIIWHRLLSDLFVIKLARILIYTLVNSDARLFYASTSLKMLACVTSVQVSNAMLEMPNFGC